MESLMNALERQKISLPIANTKTMLLYPDFLQPLAVKLANEHRSKGMDVALVCFARDKVLADYEEYGRKLIDTATALAEGRKVGRLRMVTPTLVVRQSSGACHER